MDRGSLHKSLSEAIGNPNASGVAMDIAAYIGFLNTGCADLLTTFSSKKKIFLVGNKK